MKTVSSTLKTLGKLSDSDSYLSFSSVLLQILEHKTIPHGNPASLSQTDSLHRLEFATLMDKNRKKVKGGTAML